MKHFKAAATLMNRSRESKDSRDRQFVEMYASSLPLMASRLYAAAGLLAEAKEMAKDALASVKTSSERSQAANVGSSGAAVQFQLALVSLTEVIRDPKLRPTEVGRQAMLAAKEALAALRANAGTFEAQLGQSTSLWERGIQSENPKAAEDAKKSTSIRRAAALVVESLIHLANPEEKTLARGPLGIALVAFNGPLGLPLMTAESLGVIGNLSLQMGPAHYDKAARLLAGARTILDSARCVQSMGALLPALRSLAQAKGDEAGAEEFAVRIRDTTERATEGLEELGRILPLHHVRNLVDGSALSTRKRRSRSTSAPVIEDAPNRETSTSATTTTNTNPSTDASASIDSANSLPKSPAVSAAVHLSDETTKRRKSMGVVDAQKE